MEKGPSRPTLFSVRLPAFKVGAFTNEYLDLFCTTTSIPEVRVNTVAVAGHEYMGIVREQPTAVMFGKPFNMTLIENREFLAYKNLRGWFDQTAQNANQGSPLLGNNTFSSGRSQRMKYYKTFAADFQLVKLEYGGPGVGGFTTYREVMKVNFINGFPIGIGDIELSTELNDQPTKYSASFTYESYNVSYDNLSILQIKDSILSVI
ncbi:hypothetical protein [Synechococcus phage S-B68]|nr:hypothetical protein [Synechococcus phage S-B68]